MLEVLYDAETLEVRAWNRDMAVKGNLKPKAGEKVIVLNSDLPDYQSSNWKVDLVKKVVYGTPLEQPKSLAQEVADLKVLVASLQAKLNP